MRAPCGVDIKVGQVWERNDRQYTIMLIEDSIRPLKITGADGSSFWASARNFTNKHSGYSLVKDVCVK